MNYKNIICFSFALFLETACLAAPLPNTTFKDVVKKAQAISKEPFISHENRIPDQLKKIGYDEWRDLRFNPEKSLWADGPFSIQFFHLGFIYQEPVRVNIIEKRRTQKIPFSADLFDYSQSAIKKNLPDDSGFAGFRIHYPINSPDYADEIISFLGASYFRALGKDLAYGISARALAIDTAEPAGEEFPYFREFWIIRPGPRAKKISFHALLESRSLTGAYTFTVRPGEETLVEVKGVLFFRREVKKLGLAPLTSMFFYAENTEFKPVSDFRPEVHDSDGLLIHEHSGEWTWHPLINPKTLLVNSFTGGQPRGFGLIQRDTSFDHYQDLEARYDKRPSVWVTPKSDWGPGRIELLQIPTKNEYNDNIGAYWVSDTPFKPGSTFEYACTLSWHHGSRKQSALAYVEATRVMTKSETAVFIVDFLPDSSQTSFPEEEISADIQIFNGYETAFSQVIKNTVTNGWRLVIHVNLTQERLLDKVLPGPKPAVELRALLKYQTTPISETWSYTYLP